jgi:hypothetical protein
MKSMNAMFAEGPFFLDSSVATLRPATSLMLREN